MSSMRVDILERELSKLKKKDPKRFKKIINKLLDISDTEPPKKESIKIEPTYSIFQHPEIEKSAISDLPDNPTFIEQSFYTTISKLSTQNEKTFFDTIVTSNGIKDSTLQVSDEIFEVIKKLYFVDSIDDEEIKINFRIQRDNGTLLSPSPYSKARKIAIDLINNKETNFSNLFEAIKGPLINSEFQKRSKKMLVDIIKKMKKKIDKKEFITIITLNIRNISNKYYESIERRDMKINPEDLLFIFPLYEGFNNLRLNFSLFSQIEGKYKMDVLFEWSNSHQVNFTIWMVSFLIAIKLYNLSSGGK